MVSLGLHALGLAVLALSVRPVPAPPEPPPVQVSLIDIAPSDPIFQPIRPAPPPLTPRPGLTPPVILAAPPPVLRGAPQRGAPTPAPDTPQIGERAPYMSFYQDNVKGCEREALMLMPDEEQARCRDRIAAAALSARRGFRRDGPPIEALSALAAARRAALDAEIARRARAGIPMGRPVQACTGRLGNLGAACLPGEGDQP